ncbi:RICIN domain-containing protein [Streptomyces sp. NPDC087901]|uniref:RICIN domain-containing protein n=1 Tax=Streptomyces sp. NPDC087901 TaxID=3365818 RepID=UPI00381660D3
MAGLATAATVLMAGSPAQAVEWPSDIYAFQNAYTGKCLSGSGRSVSQLPCGLSVPQGGSRSTDWNVADTDMPNSVKGGFIIRNKATGLCLDTNGADVYLSGCATSDLGQLWTLNNCEQSFTSWLAHQPLTGWNSGGVSVAAPETVDNDMKSRWHLVGDTGCGG